jgi:hypothetical protein
MQKHTDKPTEEEEEYVEDADFESDHKEVKPSPGLLKPSIGRGKGGRI